MYKQVRKLSDQKFVDIAAWYSTLELSAKTFPGDAYTYAPDLVSLGDKQRGIPACDSCHGKDGKGAPLDVPSMTGQYAEYLNSTFESYRDGTRNNDLDLVVSNILKKLTEEESVEIAAYYESLGDYDID